MEVKIVDFDDTPVAVLEHRGSPATVNATAQQFIEWRKTSGLSPITSCRTFGVPWNDPESVPPEEFRFDICGEITRDVPENPQGVDNKTIPGGRCAVVRHHGSTDQIGESVWYLYRDWLPQSGEELRDFPVFFHYLTLGSVTPEHELETDVYLPLK
jgi:AraC family transcriptional regulator